MEPMNFAFHCKSKPEPTGKKVAIIGAGPAGLAAAGYLVCKGHEIDVYDKLPEPGGLMIFGIPELRIPIERVRGGCKILEEKFGVRFITRTKVIQGERHDEGDELAENTVSLKELMEKYDAVLITTGTWRSRIPKIEGSELEGVYAALEYLYRLKAHKLGYLSEEHVPEVKGRVVAVIGAGYSAVDAALESLLEGARKVYLLYRRTIQEAPAGIYEINALRQKGVEWMELVSPKRIIGKDKVEKLELIKNKLGEPDETGRRKPIPIEGSEFTLDVDMVIFATGEITTPPFTEDLGIAVDDRGRIVVDEKYMTSIEGVFAAGDVVTGPSKVGHAVLSGLKAAKALDLWLRSR
ncbi:MAG TPA: glutamate synthase [Euryarchaeota archaeon]|nr:glutamate synthase [Euryarchaeota archaeon]